MGGKTSTSWKPGQVGNPKGRPKLTEEQKLQRSHTAAALGLVPGAGNEGMIAGARPSPTAPQEPVSDGMARNVLRRLIGKSILRLESDLNNGGDKGHQAAKYILDQVLGKATETVKHSGEGPGWEIKWTRLADRAVKTDRPVN